MTVQENVCHVLKLLQGRNSPVVKNTNVMMDKEISKNKKVGEFGRDLVPWDASDSPAPDLGLQTNQGSHKNGHWDQFAVNAAKFGVKSTWNENVSLYYYQ